MVVGCSKRMDGTEDWWRAHCSWSAPCWPTAEDRVDGSSLTCVHLLPPCLGTYSVSAGSGR